MKIMKNLSVLPIDQRLSKPLYVNPDLIYSLFSLAVVLLTGSSILWGSPILLVLAFAPISALLAASILSPRIVITVAFLMSSLTGGLSSISIEGLPYSANGLLIGLILISSILSLAVHAHELKRSWFTSVLLFTFFILWLSFRVPGSPDFSTATKDVGLMAAPVIVYFVIRLTVMEQWRRIIQVERLLIIYSVIPVVILLIGYSLGYVSITELGFVTPIGRRTLALFLLAVLSISLAWWRLGRSRGERKIGILWSIFLMALILTSLSRTVIVIAAGLLSITFLRPKHIFQWVLVIGVGLLIFVILFQIPQFRARFFFEQGSFSDILNLERLNTQGRAYIWPVVWRHAMENPITGNGAGSSRLLVNSFTSLDHPHNDYLRVFHDTGFIGLFLFILAWGERLFRQWKSWVLNEKVRPEVAKYQMAAFLGGLSVVLSFTTDNTLVYTFVTIPVFTVFALADAAILKRDKQV